MQIEELVQRQIDYGVVVQLVQDNTAALLHDALSKWGSNLVIFVHNQIGILRMTFCVYGIVSKQVLVGSASSLELLYLKFNHQTPPYLCAYIPRLLPLLMPTIRRRQRLIHIVHALVCKHFAITAPHKGCPICRTLVGVNVFSVYEMEAVGFAEVRHGATSGSWQPYGSAWPLEWPAFESLSAYTRAYTDPGRSLLECCQARREILPLSNLESHRRQTQ